METELVVAITPPPHSDKSTKSNIKNIAENLLQSAATPLEKEKDTSDPFDGNSFRYHNNNHTVKQDIKSEVKYCLLILIRRARC